jgi:hypothetical protein
MPTVNDYRNKYIKKAKILSINSTVLSSSFDESFNISNANEDDLLVYSNGSWKNKTRFDLVPEGLSNLSDVQYSTTPAEDDLLIYSNGSWKNKTKIDIVPEGLSNLSDVQYVSTPVDDEIIKWQGGRWINASLSGTVPASLNDLDGVTITLPESTSDYFGYSAGQWRNLPNPLLQTEVAVGSNSGNNGGATAQNFGSVALGFNAGSNNQGSNSIAIGINAGSNFQGDNSIAIGRNTGVDNQGTNSILIGSNVGKTNAADRTILIGSDIESAYAGSIVLNTSNGTFTTPNAGVFIGPGVMNGGDFAKDNKIMLYDVNSGEITNVSWAGPALSNLNDVEITGPIADGATLLFNKDSNRWINEPLLAQIPSTAIADITDINFPNLISGGIMYTPDTTFWTNSTVNAYYQTNNGLGLGSSIELTGSNGIAIGKELSNLGTNSIAIGSNSGDGDYTVAIGNNAGSTNRCNYSVAVGFNAGSDSQGLNSIAIGSNAAQSSQGQHSIG